MAFTIIKVSELEKMVNELKKDKIEFVDILHCEELEVSDNEIIPASLQFLAFNPDIPNQRIDFGHIEVAFDQIED